MLLTEAILIIVYLMYLLYININTSLFILYEGYVQYWEFFDRGLA